MSARITVIAEYNLIRVHQRLWLRLHFAMCIGGFGLQPTCLNQCDQCNPRLNWPHDPPTASTAASH